MFNVYVHLDVLGLPDDISIATSSSRHSGGSCPTRDWADATTS